mgnify:FL=1
MRVTTKILGASYMAALTNLYLPADLVAEWDGRHALHVDNAMNLEWWVQGGCEVFRNDYAAFCRDPLCAALEAANHILWADICAAKDRETRELRWRWKLRISDLCTERRSAILEEMYNK